MREYYTDQVVFLILSVGKKFEDDQDIGDEYNCIAIDRT